MASYKLGSVKLDSDVLQAELARLRDGHFSNAYKDYSIGYWQTSVLANRTGRAIDTLSEEYIGSAKVTEIGELFPYALSLVRSVFQWSHIKSVRFFRCATESLIVPHRDYLEFRQGFLRYHFALLDGEQCLNSENDKVFRLQRGEIWFLDATEVHSAGCFGEQAKLNLVVDVDPASLEADRFVSGFQPVKAALQDLPRSELNADDLRVIYNLASAITPDNFSAIVAQLARIHFFKRVDCARLYDWLDEISLNSKNEALIVKAREMREFFIGKQPT